MSIFHLIKEQYGIKVKGGDRGAQSLVFCIMLSRSLFACDHCLSVILPIGKQIVSTVCETFCYRFYLSKNLPATRAENSLYAIYWNPVWSNNEYEVTQIWHR